MRYIEALSMAANSLLTLSQLTAAVTGVQEAF